MNPTAATTASTGTPTRTGVPPSAPNNAQRRQFLATSSAVAGGLMLAFFQIPNKFFEPDGRVVDMGGADWQALWSVALAAERS
mgnify:CR=1 FL=1